MTVHVDRSLCLPTSQYFADPQRKTGIALHHTVCRSARITLSYWRNDTTLGGRPRKVGTAFVIDPDGTIYEAFDPAHWAWQFGLSWPDGRRSRFEKRFIGIELTSEGGLAEPRAENVFDAGTEYRGYRWFDRYEDQQLASLGRLVDGLCTEFSIPRVYPEQPYLYHGDALESFEGVIGHAMVRADKSDPAPDPRLWQTLQMSARARPVPVAHSARVTGIAPSLTRQELDALFSSNVRRLDRMNVAAGSLLKTLLMELQRREVYLRLEQPAHGAHRIGYDVAQGDGSEVIRLAGALGFRKATGRVLEVDHA